MKLGEIYNYYKKLLFFKLNRFTSSNPYNFVEARARNLIINQSKFKNKRNYVHCLTARIGDECNLQIITICMYLHKLINM